VLVGGQSLTAWVEYYKIKLPAFEGALPNDRLHRCER
jgi:hypothetical protein